MAAGDNSPIYDDLMRLKPEGLTPNAWAVKAGVSRTVWADMRRHGNPSRRTLQKLLTAAGSSLAEFEALRIHGSSIQAAATGLSDRRGAEWSARQLPPLSVLGTASAGYWGDPARQVELTELHTEESVDRAPRPASLAGDASAFAVTIVGNSMWPRFRPGRLVAVSPKAAIAVGDDVLVRLKDGAGGRGAARVLIKELTAKTGRGVELRQFNPDLTFHVEADHIEAIEKVLGELV